MLPDFAFLPPPLRRLALRLIYTSELTILASIFLCPVLPLSCFAGLAYGVASQAQNMIMGKSPGHYIEDANMKKGGISFFQRLMVLHRAPMVLAFVLPLSQLFQIYGRLRNEFVQAIHSAPSLHAQRVKHITDQFMQWKAEGGTKRIVTARPGWHRVSMKNSTYKIDKFQVRTDRMIDVLEVDTVNRTVTVEPMVTMGHLIPMLMKKGWTLPVVPELEELTVGGMIAGTGIESSSHHSGLFQEFCIELEVVLASGEVVTCSKKEREDLFEAFFWSYGTLGMLVSAKLRIIPSAPYIRLTYHGFDTEKGFIDRWTAEANKGLKLAEAGGDDVQLPDYVEGGCHRFVEGLMFSKTHGVVMVGDFANEVGKDGQLYEHGKWYKPYFYMHAQDNMDKAINGKPVVEYIPLKEYYYRHSRSVFWEMENIVPLGHSPLFRFLYGWMLPPSVAFLKVTTPQTIYEFYQEKHVIQDMLVPATKLQEGLAILHKHIEFYPLWVCPMVLPPGRGLVHAKGDKAVMYVDLGVYGVPRAVKRGEDYDVVHEVRAVEHYVQSVDGFEMLYAECYMMRNEFANMFDRKLYDELRQRLGADKAFPDVYDKIVEPKRNQYLQDRYGKSN